MNKINKNFIFLGVFALFFGLTYTASACEPYFNGSTNCNQANYTNYTGNQPRIVSDDGGAYYRETAYANIDTSRNDTSAYTNYNPNYVSVNSGSSTYGTAPQYGNIYTSNGPEVVNTTNTSNGAATNTNRNTTITRTVTNNKVATNTTTKRDNTNDTTTTNVSNDNASVSQESEMNNNSLTALSLHGSNSFLPDTVWEWICVFFLMLVIIILIRQFRKRASHDVHAVAHH